jgi:uncharacterized protein YndB with AHSA1/START domain
MTDTQIPEVPEALDDHVYITRAFAAPRDVVWKFFTEPELLAKWFGPHAVHTDPASVRVDLRPGGAWHLDMVDDDGPGRYPMRAVLNAVIPPEYLEGRLDADAQEGPVRGVTLRIWLHDHGDKTRMTLVQGPFSPEFCTQTTNGWLESFDKIDAIIADGIR